MPVANRARILLAMVGWMVFLPAGETLSNPPYLALPPDALKKLFLGYREIVDHRGQVLALLTKTLSEPREL